MSAQSEKRQRVAASAVRCAIYVRISLDREGAGLGVERQEQECRELCERKGWHVVEVYVDNDVSATSKKPRPEWQRLLMDVNNGRINAIAVWHVDRMTRQPRELEDVIDLAEKLGVQLGTVTGEIDLSTPTGKLVARMLGAAARHEAEHKGERQRVQRAQSAKKGHPNMGGPRPFGYAADRISAVPDEAEAIRNAARRVLAGETLRSIAEEWNANGVTTSGGKLWTGSMVRQMLISARISGRREIGGSHGKLGEIVNDSAWQAIITPKQSDRLRVLLTSRQSDHSTERKYLLSGLLTCSKCYAKMVSLGNYRDGTKPALYRCPASGARSDVKSCGATSVQMRYADATMIAHLLATITTPELMSRLHER
jgi:site-specific DNA recombinase